MIVSANSYRVMIVQPAVGQLTETFLRAHAERLPAETIVVHGYLPQLNDEPVLDCSIGTAVRLAWRLASGVRPRQGWERWAITCAYLHVIKRLKPDLVLGEYGPISTHVMEACARTGTPLVSCFHGYDASKTEVLERYRGAYQELFRSAAGVVAVSRAMEKQLISLGAPPDRVWYNPYGVDCDRFAGAAPKRAAPTFVSVGRFVEKKGPHLTLIAFAQARKTAPDARLRMIGDGPLLQICRDVAGALGIESAVDFLGPQSHEIVQQEMRQARAFVQHSVVASDGDSEGTPVAVLEAAASGLPVVATRHAGIPDVVIDGQTGLLIAERDVAGMAAHLQKLASCPSYAQELGEAARRHVAENFSMEQSISRLWSHLEQVILDRRTKRAGSRLG